MTEDALDSLHELPRHEMSAYDMHVELARAAHRGCSTENCRTVRYCWYALRELEHDPDRPTQCSPCLTHDGGRADYLAAVRTGR